MTVREVLETDWTVDRIEVTVREKNTTKYIMQYRIGRNVDAGKSERFAYESDAGDVYENAGMKVLVMKKIIQYRQKSKKPQGKEMCVGVILQEIPKEILELSVYYMSPYHCGYSNEMHGYRFECYVNSWAGIPGENKQIEFNESN